MIDKLLEENFGDRCDLDPAELYWVDRSGADPVKPIAVVRCSCDDEIRHLLEFANSQQISVTVRGAGTGKSGGAIPEASGIVMLLEGYDQVLDCDPRNRSIRVQPMVIVDDIKATADQVSLFYPPDPASAGRCSIGGCVSENAGGLSSLRYGVTGDYVLGIKGFWGSGQPFSVGSDCHKDVAGYDLKRLIVGSEGTLAVITEITLRLLPKPRFEQTVLCGFGSAKQACEAASELLYSGLLLSALEYFDSRCVALSSVDIPRHAAYLLCRFEQEPALNWNQTLSTVEVVYDESADVYWDFRRSISECLRDGYTYKVSEDVTVPPSRVYDLLEGLKIVESDTGLTLIAYGHLGDGNLHVNILCSDLDRHDWELKRDNAIDAVMRLSLKLGGTITGEHGVGLTKKPYMSMQFSDQELSLMWQLKRVFDPNNVLNRGKCFPDAFYH